MTTAHKINRVCEDIREMLLEKNRKYGDSAINPVRIFSQASPVEQIKVRLDDKLSRLKSAQLDEDEDVILDLIGYLVLFIVVKTERIQNGKSHTTGRTGSGTQAGEGVEYLDAEPIFRMPQKDLFQQDPQNSGAEEPTPRPWDRPARDLGEMLKERINRDSGGGGKDHTTDTRVKIPWRDPGTGGGIR